MKHFLHKLWNSRLKGTLLAAPALAIGIFINHLAGSTGQLSLPAQTATDFMLIWGGSLFAICGVAYSYYQDLERFKKEHEDEEQIRDGVLFMRGKRTGGKWMAFCPVCQRPADTTLLVKCPNPKCGWQVLKEKKEIDQMISKLYL